MPSPLRLYLLSIGLNEEWASLQTELSTAETEMAALQDQLDAALRDKEEAEEGCESKVRSKGSTVSIDLDL